jgi:hypothetical protein
MAQRLGIDRLHITLSAEDRIDLASQQAQLGAAPEHLGHRLVVAKPDAAPEQAPTLAVIIGAAEHGGQEVLLVEQQLTGRHGRHWWLWVGAWNREGAVWGLDVIAAADGVIHPGRSSRAARGWRSLRWGLRLLDPMAGGEVPSG